MHLILHVPNASPASLERGVAAARAVFDAGAAAVHGASFRDARREAAALHSLAEVAAIEACLAGAPYRRDAGWNASDSAELAIGIAVPRCWQMLLRPDEAE